MKTIRSKIIGTFSVLVVLSLAASFWSIYNFYDTGNTVARMLNENYNSVLAAENMVKALLRQDNALVAASEAEEATSGGGFEENKELFYFWHSEAARRLTGPEQELLSDSIRIAFSQYTVLADSVLDRVSQGALSEAKDFYYDRMRATSDRLRELCFSLFTTNQQAMFNSEAQTKSLGNRTALVVMLASLGSLALSVVATAWLINVVIEPAEKLTETIKQVGAGKLDLKTDIVSNDEIGDLSREFNKMTERLRRYDLINIEKILSEKRKSEAIVESIPDGVIVTDAEMRIIHINHTIASLFDCPEHVVGVPVGSVIPDERILHLIRNGSRREEAGEPQYLQYDHHEKRMYFRAKVTSIFDSGGQLFGVVTMLQDVTQFKELDRLKSDFIATLSHEFRTPLTSINMSVDILNQEILGPLNERQKELINAAKEDSQRLTRLAKELLQLSKLESGKFEFHNEELDARTVIESSVRPLQLQFTEKKIHLAVDIEPALPPLVADEQQISSVISNLLTNALKYTDPGGRVELRASADPSGLRVDVRDTGVGIRKEDLQRIFDKFAQVKGMGSDTAPGGVGLGLAIAKEIVHAYGGTIWAESVPGRGSTFSFTLPLRVVAIPSRGS